MNEPKPLENRMTNAELADELDAEVKNEHSGKIANLMMRASAALRQSSDKVLVPSEPTIEMNKAGAVVLNGNAGLAGAGWGTAAHVYRAMLSAAEAEGHHE